MYCLIGIDSLPSDKGPVLWLRFSGCYSPYSKVKEIVKINVVRYTRELLTIKLTADPYSSHGLIVLLQHTFVQQRTQMRYIQPEYFIKMDLGFGNPS